MEALFSFSIWPRQDYKNKRTNKKWQSTL